jgi:hypothetical protein
MYGYKPIVRVPVIGRTGPDLTINQLNLVIDVKSRLEVPKGIYFDYPIEFDGFLAVPLCQLGEIACGGPRSIDFTSKTVRDYYTHIDEWRVANYPDGITALVLHRPKIPIGASMFIISKSDRSKLCHVLQNSIS